MVAQGRFRADLYYRLNVLTIPVPRLRERLSDIETLSYSVLDKLCAQHHTGHLSWTRPPCACSRRMAGRATCGNCTTRWSVP